MRLLSLEIHEETYAELKILLDEHRKYRGEYGPRFESIQDVIRHVAGTVAAGSARPGSWERQLLYPMGLIPLESPVFENTRRIGTLNLNH